MALKIVTGGTTGAADGTLVSSGSPLVIVALNTAIDAHIRCDDGYWSADQDFDVPAELEVSFDAGSTWYGNADEPITAPEIYAVNYPIKIRQTTAAASTSGSFITDGTYTAIAALTTPTLTVTPGNTQNALSWTNVSNEDASPGYTVEWSANGSTGWTALTTTAQNVTTYTDTGLTNGVIRYYRVKAEGSGRYSDSGWGTGNGTPVLEEFASLDSAKWLSVVSGSGAVSIVSGKAQVSKPATGDRAILVSKSLSYPHGSATKVVTALVDLSTVPTADASQVTLFGFMRQTAAPVAGDVGTPWAYTNQLLGVEFVRLSGNNGYRFKTVTSAPGLNLWHSGSSSWVDAASDAWGSTRWALPSGDSAAYRVEVEFSASNGARMALRSSDGATLHRQTGWIAWSSLTGGSGNNLWPVFGGFQFTYNTAFLGVVNADWIRET